MAAGGATVAPVLPGDDHGDRNANDGGDGRDHRPQALLLSRFDHERLPASSAAEHLEAKPAGRAPNLCSCRTASWLTTEGFGRWGVVAACPQGTGLCCVSRAGLLVPRTTVPGGRPWALAIPPGAPAARSQALRWLLARERPAGDPRMIAVAITAEPEGDPSVDELAIGGRRLDPGASPPPLRRLRFTFI